MLFLGIKRYTIDELHKAFKAFPSKYQPWDTHDGKNPIDNTTGIFNLKKRCIEQNGIAMAMPNYDAVSWIFMNHVIRNGSFSWSLDLQLISDLKIDSFPMEIRSSLGDRPMAENTKAIQGWRHSLQCWTKVLILTLIFLMLLDLPTQNDSLKETTGLRNSCSQVPNCSGI